MLDEKDTLIDEMDMDFLVLLNKAVIGGNLSDEEKKEIRMKLDRWSRALNMTHTIRVTF